MNAAQIALGLFTYTILVVSAIVALVMYLVEAINGDFFETALLTNATVTNIEQQNYGDHDVMVTITYRPEKRGQMTGVINDGRSTDFVLGQNITVLYDPEEPEDVKPKKDREYAEIVSQIKVGSIIIFLITLGLVIYGAKNKEAKPEERIRN